MAVVARLALACGLTSLWQVSGAAAQTEAVARRECLQAAREQGIRGYALDNPRFVRATDQASLTGILAQGASRIEFTCVIDRRGKITELVLTAPQR